MKHEQRRLLEMAGILRRGTPNHILFEGDEEGGDDLFGDDGGDDGGGDDLFGDDSGGDDGGDAGGEDGGAEADSGPERVPPEELSPEDIEKFGSPRFLDIEQNIKNMFNDAMSSAGAASQNLETYPGQAMAEDDADPSPAKDDEPEEAEEEEEANESFYRYGNRRDKWLINEANRLLLEAEEEGSAADIFDMERFCTELANYMDNIHNTEDVEAGIFNGARQMILNNFGPETEEEFIQMLSSVAGDNYTFLQTGFEGGPETPIAVGGTGGGGGA